MIAFIPFSDFSFDSYEVNLDCVPWIYHSTGTHTDNGNIPDDQFTMFTLGRNENNYSETCTEMWDTEGSYFILLIGEGDSSDPYQVKGVGGFDYGSDCPIDGGQCPENC